MSDFHDMTGRRVHDSVIVKVAGRSDHGHIQWIVMCSAGHRFRRYASELRKAIAAGRPLRCKTCAAKRRKDKADLAQLNDEKECIDCKQVKSLSEFYLHKKMADGRQSRCKRCDTRNKRGPGSRVRAAQPKCKVCGSLPWRVVGGTCVRCGLEYATEAPITSVDTMNNPHESRSVEPAGGSE